jgi:spermidine synthase
MYYGPNSGIGVVLQNRPQRFTGAGMRIGVVGLGAGTIAAYGHRGDSISYYEINPDVVRLAAGDSPEFTYIRDSAASVNVKVGDARLVMDRELAEGHAQNFDVLALDAFNGDAIPVHLLTKEAFDIYWRHLNPDTGVIAVHITSRHVNLVPVLQGAADYLQVPYVLTLSHGQGPVLDSLWFLMARNPEMLRTKTLEPITIKYVHNVGPRLWTDDYSDIFRLLY